MNKEERICEEYERLKKQFEYIPEDKNEVVEPLIQNSAFMKVTLQELQDEINNNGVVSVYKNGENQFGVKASAELQSYNQLMKNYTTVQAKLLKLLPDKPVEKRTVLDEVIEMLESDL